jgi:hypothetical protein
VGCGVSQTPRYANKLKGMGVNMKKELPLANPIISTYLGYASSLSIILNEEKGFEWFVQNYMNIITVYTNDYDELFMDFLNISNLYLTSQETYQPDNFLCLPLKTYSVPRAFARWDSIIDFIKEQIDNNYYICMFIDRTYIRQHTLKIMHDAFIYGYDDEKQSLYICDYFNGGKFIRYECPYQEFTNAYRYAKDRSGGNAVFYNDTDVSKINLLSYNNLYSESFDLSLFIDNLKYYINPQMYSMNFRIHICRVKDKNKVKTCYGNENIKIIYNYIKNRMEKNEDIDIRQVHLFYEHKCTYKFRIKYLHDKNIILDKENIEFMKSCDKLEGLAQNIRNLSIKYNIQIEQKINIRNIDFYIENIKMNLENLYKAEKDFIEKLIIETTRVV